MACASTTHVHLPEGHPPGYLQDCPGCEAECHCEPEEHGPSCKHPRDGQLHHVSPCVWPGHPTEEDEE